MIECTKCKEQKELTDFSKKKTNKGGLQYYCKCCDSIIRTNNTRTKTGKLKNIYQGQVSSSKRRGNEPPKYTKQEFVDRFVNDLDYDRHYYSWVISNYSKDYSPGFDRKDDYKGYSFDNIQIMYWFENKSKYNSDVKKGINRKTSKPVIGTNIKTGEEIEFYSAKDAKKNGFQSTNICNCCKGNRTSHKGYTWKYKD